MKLKKLSAAISLFAASAIVIFAFQNCGKSVYGQAELDEDVLEEPNPEEPSAPVTAAYSLSSLSVKDQSTNAEVERSSLIVKKSYTLSLPAQANTDGAVLYYEALPGTTAACLVARMPSTNVSYAISCSTAGNLRLQMKLQQPNAADSASIVTLSFL